jgi:hypothetical protein
MPAVRLHCFGKITFLDLGPATLFLVCFHPYNPTLLVEIAGWVYGKLFFQSSATLAIRRGDDAKH